MRVRRCSICRTLGLALGLALSGLVSSGAAQATASAGSAGKASSAAFSPVAVKAAYLVNLIRFTTWPDDRHNEKAGPLVIAVANNRALEDELLRIAEGQTLRGRRLRVVRVRSARDFDACHLAWVEPAPDLAVDFPATLRDSLSQARGRPLLTVSDTPGFLDEGGMVELYRDGENLRFAIDARAARAEGLVLSSRLLALSRPASPYPAEIMSSDLSPAP